MNTAGALLVFAFSVFAGFRSLKNGRTALAVFFVGIAIIALMLLGF